MRNATTERRLSAVLTLAAKVRRVWVEERLRIYAVPSQSEPVDRLVRLWPNGAMDCDCPGGVHNRACIHCAAVLLARQWWRQGAALRLRREGTPYCRHRVQAKAA